MFNCIDNIRLVQPPIRAVENRRISEQILNSERELISGYFACPIDLYGSELYESSINIARSQFPKVRFIEPALMNWNAASWLDAWVKILPILGMLTCLPRQDRSIGRGCYKEIKDAHAVGIPIWIFDHDQNVFSPFSKLIRIKFALRSLPYYSRVY